MASELSTHIAARLAKARRKLATAKRLFDEAEFEDAAEALLRSEGHLT